MGNIGVPVFSDMANIKSDTVVVYELSCHQLQYVKASPNIAVLLNVYSDHLDHYRSFEEYRDAKFNIFKYQTENDTLIVNSTCENIDISMFDGGKTARHIRKRQKTGAVLTVKNMYVCGKVVPLERVKTTLIGKT